MPVNPSSDQPRPLLYTVRQTAEVFSYGVRTVWRLISAGELEKFKGPGPTRVRGRVH